MRLINIHTMQMKEFTADAPPYAILSHRWTYEELTYRDFIKGRGKHTMGFRKILAFCDFIKEMSRESPNDCGIGWIWIDTCCIDKRSSAELSEAINSMWSYYLNAIYCVVHLNDVIATVEHPAQCRTQAWSSDWFTRGWTLQELLAPRDIIFCNTTWQIIGSRDSLGDWSGKYVLEYAFLEQATGIPAEYLGGQAVGSTKFIDACFAEKVSWAAHRKTTRDEDRAYCLLGLLNLNMPLLYGEGGPAAFRRLQKEFIQQSADESVFAWHTGRDDGRFWGLLAPSPSSFARSRTVREIHPNYFAYEDRPPYAVTNKGLQFEGRTIYLGKLMTTTSGLPARKIYVMSLNCEQVSVNEQGDDPSNQKQRTKLVRKKDRFLLAFEDAGRMSLDRISLETVMATPDLNKALWKYLNGSRSPEQVASKQTHFLRLS